MLDIGCSKITTSNINICGTETEKEKNWQVKRVLKLRVIIPLHLQTIRIDFIIHNTVILSLSSF